MSFMSHPMIGDLTEKTDEELMETISQLTKKLVFAGRTNNQPMINQIQMALTSYRSEHQKRQSQELEKSGLVSGKIDIS